ncbi:hypothetical protein [Virgisporangium ochraceum]|nr:hypothetical protein [Virgisporangium ochraceum]
MDDDGWLTNAEDELLGPLEDSPLPLWEIRGGHVTTGRLEAYLVPGLTSLAARGLIEVRRFDGWPQSWDRGSPMAGEDLLRYCRRLDAWSPGATPVLAAHITPEGRRCL